MTEKISVTLNVTELGQVDYLVERGLYNSRSDFMRLAMRKTLEEHKNELEQFLNEGQDEKEGVHRIFVLGITNLTKKTVIRMLDRGQRLHVRLVGALFVDKDITAEEIRKLQPDVRVIGKVIAEDDVKKALGV